MTPCRLSGSLLITTIRLGHGAHLRISTSNVIQRSCRERREDSFIEKDSCMCWNRFFVSSYYLAIDQRYPNMTYFCTKCKTCSLLIISIFCDFRISNNSTYDVWHCTGPTFRGEKMLEEGSSFWFHSQTHEES